MLKIGVRFEKRRKTIKQRDYGTKVEHKLKTTTGRGSLLTLISLAVEMGDLYRRW